MWAFDNLLVWCWYTLIILLRADECFQYCFSIAIRKHFLFRHYCSCSSADTKLSLPTPLQFNIYLLINGLHMHASNTLMCNPWLLLVLDMLCIVRALIDYIFPCACVCCNRSQMTSQRVKDKRIRDEVEGRVTVVLYTLPRLFWSITVHTHGKM